MSESIRPDASVESDALERLQRAREALADVESRIDAHGEETVERVAAAYRDAERLLDSYVDRATGTGRENFQAYVKLEGEFSSLVEGLADDVARRGAFEDALEILDKRRLSEADFERARAALEPAAAFSELLDERQDAEDERVSARVTARDRLETIADEIEECERVLELATADLDAPVDRLREPIETYDDRVRDAFAAFRRDASARDVFALLERSRLYPLVPFERPPADLRSYVAENPAGEYAIPELLEYADYSRSKLDHYVDSAGELKRRVATRQTYLEGIDADPLTIGWPPESAAVLRYRTREIRPLVERFADEDVVTTLRDVRRLARDPAYDRLQTAAEARERLSADQRERLRDGRIEDELAALRAERERLEAALAEDGGAGG